MTLNQVEIVIRWLRRKNRDLANLTLLELTAGAYAHSNEGKLDEIKINKGFKMLTTCGEAPWWLDRFIRKEIYPNFIIQGDANEKPEG